MTPHHGPDPATRTLREPHPSDRVPTPRLSLPPESGTTADASPTLEGGYLIEMLKEALRRHGEV